MPHGPFSRSGAEARFAGQKHVLRLHVASRAWSEQRELRNAKPGVAAAKGSEVRDGFQFIPRSLRLLRETSFPENQSRDEWD